MAKAPILVHCPHCKFEGPLAMQKKSVSGFESVAWFVAVLMAANAYANAAPLGWLGLPVAFLISFVRVNGGTPIVRCPDCRDERVVELHTWKARQPTKEAS